MSQFIYKITHKDTGKSYIGQTNDVDRRWKEHTKIQNLTSGNNANKSWSSYIRNAISKHGVERFTFEILTECDKKEANDLEVQKIKEYHTLSPNGYNLLNGGLANGHHQESRDKMSKSHTGKILTDVTKERMSKSRMGELNPNFGKLSCNATPIAKYTLDGDFIQNFNSIKLAAESVSGTSSSIRVSATKNNTSAYNFLWKKINGEIVMKIPKLDTSNYNLVKRNIQGHSPSSDIIQFESIKQAAEHIGCAPSNISACLSWTQWQYITDKKENRFIATKDDVEIFCDSYKDALDKTGAFSKDINGCINGTRKTAKGYTWRISQ